MQFQRQPLSSFLKRYFQDNPERLQNYVGLGLKAISLVVSPLTATLRHLIEVQGLDPNTEPGRKLREAFQQALDNAFLQFHDHDYDSDFDFSWLNKKFEQTRKDLESLDLNKEDFRKMTDVGQLRSTGQTLDVAEQSFSVNNSTLKSDLQSNIPVAIDQTPVQELAQLLDMGQINPSAPLPVEQECDVSDDENWLTPDSDLYAMFVNYDEYKSGDNRSSANDMKAALKKIVEVAEAFRQRDLKEPKKTGKMRRTPTGKVNAVKKPSRKAPKLTKRTLNRNVPVAPQEDAEKIQNLIEEGHLNPQDLDLLICEGLDPKAVEMWKEKYGDKHFLEGSTLTQNLRHKHQRAKDLAYEMIARGLCTDEVKSVADQVAEILKFDDETLNSLQRVVMRYPVVRSKPQSDADLQKDK